MTVKAETLPDIRALKSEVINTIVKSLGITKAAFFIRETLSQKTDYLEIKERLFGKKTATEVYNEISKWKMKGKR
ncbi:MAG: hypothetical protein FJ242_09885 [Nitrospira sp.]|nr:hypothetical protein [Nitrospira sp.]